MPKRAVLIFVLAALLLTGCGAVGELGGQLAENAVVEGLKSFDPTWLDAWILKLNMEENFGWLYKLLIYPIIAAAVVAMFLATRDVILTLVFDGIALGLALIALLPKGMNFAEGLIVGVLDKVLMLSRIFDGMDWVPNILSNLTKLDIPGVGGVASAISLTFTLPYWYQVAGMFVVFVYIGCFVGTIVIRNTRPLALTASHIAGWLLFPIFYAIWITALISIERFQIPLFQMDTLNLGVEIPLPDTVLNLAYVLGTWLLFLLSNLGLPLIVMFAYPGHSFSGEVLQRTDVRGFLKSATSQVAGLGGLAGRMPNRRGQAKPTSSNGGDQGGLTSLPGPSGNTPLPQGPQGPSSPRPSSDAGGEKKGGSLSDRDKKEEKDLKPAKREKGGVLQPGVQDAQVLALETRQSLELGSQQSAENLGLVPEQPGQPGMPEAGREEKRNLSQRAKQVAGRKAKLLERGARAGAFLATMTGHPEIGATLSMASGVAGSTSRQLLPETESAPNTLRRDGVRPPTRKKKPSRLLPEAI